MASSPRKNIFSPWNLAYFVLGGLLLYLLLREVDLRALFRQVLTIQPGYFLLGGLLYMIKSGLRALRFTRMNRKFGSTWPGMLQITLASSLASQLLPLRLGELAYVTLLKRDSRYSVAHGLSTLAAGRILDLLAIALLFLLAALFSRQPAGLAPFMPPILLFFAGLLAAVAGMIFFTRPVAALVRRLLPDRLVARWSPALKLRATVEKLLATLAEFGPASYAEWTILAALEWGVNYGIFHVLLLGIGYSPTLFATITSVTFAALASILPVNSFGSFGTQEAGWASAWVIFGYSVEQAIGSGFATHLLTLAYMLVLGGLAWISFIATARRTRSERSNPG